MYLSTVTLVFLLAKWEPKCHEFAQRDSLWQAMSHTWCPLLPFSPSLPISVARKQPPQRHLHRSMWEGVYPSFKWAHCRGQSSDKTATRPECRRLLIALKCRKDECEEYVWQVSMRLGTRSTERVQDKNRKVEVQMWIWLGYWRKTLGKWEMALRINSGSCIWIVPGILYYVRLVLMIES